MSRPDCSLNPKSGISSESEENVDYQEARLRIGLLRQIGLLDGILHVTSEEVESWCRDCSRDHEIAKLDHWAGFQEAKIA